MDETASVGMMNWYNKLFILVSIFPFSFSDVLKYGMDDRTVCSKTSIKLFWIDDGKSALIIGKITPPEDSKAAPVCKLIFGSSSNVGRNTLHVKFETFYINDCDISLAVRQSPSSVFDTDVEQLTSLTCDMSTPPAFYTKKNNFLMFSLDRFDQYMRDYNFRINITLTEGPPQSGPSTAVIIIIAVALLSTVVVISVILIKYIRLKRVVWRERRAERAIERAIHVYNSQDLHRDVPYTTVPSHPTYPTHQTLQYGRNINSNGHNGNLLIVQLQNSSNSNSDINCSDAEISRHSLSIQDENRLNVSNREFDTESLPPSYEEALEMPKPALPESPLYANT